MDARKFFDAFYNGVLDSGVHGEGRVGRPEENIVPDLHDDSVPAAAGLAATVSPRIEPGADGYHDDHDEHLRYRAARAAYDDEHYDARDLYIANGDGDDNFARNYNAYNFYLGDK